jgi:beta propeller repeat protein
MNLAAKLKIFFIMILGIVAVFDMSVEESNEFRITTDPHNQTNPAIYGDIVVWEDNRNGNWDIYGYDLSTGQEFQITTDPHSQKSPLIYENTVVWIDERQETGVEAFYMYDLSKKVETQIQAHSSMILGHTFYKETIVWSQLSPWKGGIMVYDLHTGEEYTIPLAFLSFEEPAIFGDIVVWEDMRDEKRLIYGFNLKTKEEFPLTSSTRFLYADRRQSSPAIYENTVIWMEGSFLHAIRGFNLETGEEFPIAIIGGSLNLRSQTPAIYKDVVVWTEDRKGNRDIFAKILSTDTLFQITTDQNWQQNPAIYGDIIVWEDKRNGDWDIYGYDLSSLPPPIRDMSGLWFILSDCYYLALISVIPVSVLFGALRFKKRDRKYREISLTCRKIKDFKRNPGSLSSVAFILLGGIYLLWGLLAYHLRISSGMLYIVGATSFIFLGILYRLNYMRTPYIRVCDDELLLFKEPGPELTRIPLNTINKAVVETWTEIPSKVRLYLKDGKFAEIDLSSMKKGEDKQFLEILPELVKS